MLVPSVNTARCTKGSEGSSDLRNYQCWRSSFKSWLTCCVFSEIYPWPILFIYYLFSNWLINVSPFSLNSWHMVLYDLSSNIYEGLTYVGMGSVFLLSLQRLNPKWYIVQSKTLWKILAQMAARKRKNRVGDWLNLRVPLADRVRCPQETAGNS